MGCHTGTCPYGARQRRACQETDQQLLKEPLSTRELAEFFRHYGKANRKTRDKMVEAPHLFIKALAAKTINQKYANSSLSK